MTQLDFIVLALLGISAAIGFSRGAIREVFALVALAGLKNQWRAVWPTLAPADSAPVRV